MPVSVKRDPFPSESKPTLAVSLRGPQAKVLATLLPRRDNDHRCLWTMLTRAQILHYAGYTEKSGTVTRAINGLSKGNTSTLTGEGHLGLLALGLVETVDLDVNGTIEVNYRLTPEGLRVYRAWQAAGGKSIVRKARTSCTNNRYLFAWFKAAHPESQLTIEQWIAAGKPK